MLKLQVVTWERLQVMSQCAVQTSCTLDDEAHADLRMPRLGHLAIMSRCGPFYLPHSLPLHIYISSPLPGQLTPVLKHCRGNHQACVVITCIW